MNKKVLNIEDLYSGVLKGDRVLLGRALTLIESNAHHHQDAAQKLLQKLIAHSGKSIRIGITGPPGVGKSTFIDRFGVYLVENGHKVAVLSIDPSSAVSGGSILGDKTRMENLSVLENSFIRPSSSSGSLGGVARKTRESIIVCEAAGYDIILVETVGVGQNEWAVHSMVDLFILMQIAGAGDELQGIKKGIVELADIIVFNKADGDNLKKVENAADILKNAINILGTDEDGWKKEIVICSALSGRGIKDIWFLVEQFRKESIENNVFRKKREKQRIAWFESLFNEEIRNYFFRRDDIKEKYNNLKDAIKAGRITVVQAVKELFDGV